MIENIISNSISPPAASTALKSRSRTGGSDNTQDDFADVLKNKEKEQSKTDDLAGADAASQMQPQQLPADNPQAQDHSTEDGSSQPEYAASMVSRGALRPSVQIQVPTDLVYQAAALAVANASAPAAPATPGGVAQADDAQLTAANASAPAATIGGVTQTDDVEQTAANVSAPAATPGGFAQADDAQLNAAAAALQPAPEATSRKDGQPQFVALDNRQNFEEVLKSAAGSQPAAPGIQPRVVDPNTASQITALSQAGQAATLAGPQTAKPGAEDPAGMLKPGTTARVEEKAKASIPSEMPRPVDAGLVISQNPLQETAHAAAAVKQAALPLESQPPTVIQQMMNHLQASIQQGRGSIHMQLNPQELGAIDIHLVNSAQGVSVNVFAEQASTGRLLETQMNQLRQALTDAGVQLSNLNVSQHGQQNQPGGTFNRSPQYGHPAGSESSNQEEPRQGRGRSRSLLSGVDYLI